MLAKPTRQLRTPTNGDAAANSNVAARSNARADMCAKLSVRAATRKLRTQACGDAAARNNAAAIGTPKQCEGPKRQCRNPSTPPSSARDPSGNAATHSRNLKAADTSLRRCRCQKQCRCHRHPQAVRGTQAAMPQPIDTPKQCEGPKRQCRNPSTLRMQDDDNKSGNAAAGDALFLQRLGASMEPHVCSFAKAQQNTSTSHVAMPQPIKQCRNRLSLSLMC